jgi:hypothetical protein
MALSKTTVVDRVEVLEMGQIQVRIATVVAEDGVELTRSFERTAFMPGDDVTGQSQKVQDLANATWTADVLTAWDAWVAAQEVE